MDKIPISVVIITKNEERHLPECLESVRWAEEIVVVDDESTDRTVDIARAYTDKVLVRKMDVEGKQRNFAYDQATCTWILSLDADERVSPALAQELKHLVTKNDSARTEYKVPIRTYIGKRWIRGAGYYPAHRLRLFRKGFLRFEETGVHPRVFGLGNTGVLKNDLIHHGYRNVSHIIDKLNNQTTLEAKKWIQDKRRIGWVKILVKMMDRFSRNYFRKKGMTDGFLGFFMSACHGMYQLFTYVKYLELKQSENGGTKRIIFLDRDGVINEDPIGDYIKKWEDFHFIPGALEALQRLSQAGFEIVIVSNQAGIGDGVYSENALNEITENILKECTRHEIRISRFYYCLHGKNADCDCRKPKIGLFRKAAQDLAFHPKSTYFIGDKVADVEAGNRFGLRTLFVLTGHGKTDQNRLEGATQPEQIFPSIVEASDYVLHRSKP